MTKGKIIKITEEIITIGMDNGTIKEVRRCDVDFTPKLEDLVDVFEDKDQVIVTRRKETSTSNAGININMTNSVHTGEYVATEGKRLSIRSHIAYLHFYLDRLELSISTLERLEKQLLVFCFSGREFHALLV